jgi:sulfatase maturation enzyme AslB (radical SAM superfamily)
MSREEFVLILEKLKNQTQYIYYHLMGEPLTHPLLPEFVKLAGERGLKSIITTNGTLLKKRGEELLAAGVYKVNLSIHSFEDGTREEHVKYLRELADFAKKAADQGTIVVFRLWNQGGADRMNEEILQKLHNAFPGDWVQERPGIRIGDKVYLEHGDKFDWPDLSAEDGGNRVFCYGLRDQLGILCDGTVVPCCLDHEGDLALGNLLTRSMEEILDSPRARAIYDGFSCGVAAEELCRKCGYARRFR